MELFIGVPSDRYPSHLESRILPGRHYAKFNLQGEIDYRLMKLGIISNQVYNLLYLMKDSLYVEIYPFDISFEDPFTKIQLWLPIEQENYDL